MELESGRPRHEQISDYLREQIETGVYEVDEKLPSEKQLGTTFDVSRVTVRRALQTLEHEGYIYRRQGLGSFVEERHETQGLVRLTDFAQDMAQAGLEASSRVTHFEPEKVPGYVASRLDQDLDARLVRLDRLRLGDGAPIAFDRTWMPAFYASLLDGHDLEHETIYGILEQDYDIPITRGHYRITAANAPDDVASHLDVSPGTAVLVIERTSCSRGGKYVYFQRRYYRSDRVAYELELERAEDDTAHAGMPLRDFEPVFDASVQDDPSDESSSN
ncbi:GntR family transcriptional regulator [Longibacter salinarum]|uniref:GntR family transcriptional regulator n=1 Tax=Longibacter salinarum TaxID=1850348 RepID=A0A2A8D2W4_9BACT|nr:GntR family transcriptional regulator [Longibacter salinarum]PEN15285.1 GntR family transcriptional regulator [Longibacter salinarum]